MSSLAAERHTTAMAKERWVFSFAVRNDLRFLSHRDVLRLFQRAMARAALPVHYSGGFNPHARLSLPLPRPVGVASEAETIVVEFDQQVDGNASLEALRRQMPADIRLINARRLEGSEHLRPVGATYRLELADHSIEDLAARVQRVNSATELRVDRVHPKSGATRTVDVRPFLVEMRQDGQNIEFVLRVTDAGGIKPAEVATLLGLDQRLLNHRIRRLAVQWVNGTQAETQVK